LNNDKGHLEALRTPLELPCGKILKNRLAKSPMSDSLADGEGNPTGAQARLYEKWAEGGVALSLIGEVQGDYRFPEKPGNLVFGPHSNDDLFRKLASRAAVGDSHIWPQLGHAGALSHPPISHPKGPSSLSLEGLQCAELSAAEIKDLPDMYAKAALHAKSVGFTGVQIHAGHGFLLSQFLSPLFNHRADGYGGSIEARCRIVLEVIAKVRDAVGSLFPIGIRINSTDQLEGGLTETDSLEAIRLLNATSVDLIDISGGTYFPGAKASSDGASSGPYYVGFSRRAKEVSNVPIMVTGGFKKRDQAVDALATGAADIVGLARAMALDTELPNRWLAGSGEDPKFPRFSSVVPGGVTAWFTMRLTALGNDRESGFELDLPSAVQEYDERDAQRCVLWQKAFSH